MITMKQCLREILTSTVVAAALVAAPAAAQTPLQPAAPVVEAAPPRTINDIVTVLDQFKPNQAAAEAARAVLATPVNESVDRRALFTQYYQRGLAARKLSDDSTAIIELRKAREVLPAGEWEAFLAMGDLANAEFLSGNALNTIEVMRHRQTIVPRNLNGALMGHHTVAANYYSKLGDFNAATEAIRNAEQVFNQITRGTNLAFYRHQWTANIERGRGEVFLSSGKLAEAESSFRKALRELEADRDDREQRRRQGLTQNTDEEVEAVRGRLHRSLAQTLLREGRPNEAEINVRAALKISLERVGRFASDAINDLQVFTSILIEQGRFAEAVLMATEAVKSADGSGIPRHALTAINARRALGAALTANGKWTDALDMFDTMQRNAEQEPELARKLARGDLDWAHALLKAGRHPAARTMLQDMLTQNVQMYGERDQRTALVRGFHAVALEKTGARSEALAEFAKAVPILVDQTRNDAVAETGSVRQVRRTVYVIENYIDLMAQARRAGLTLPGIDLVAESFRLADVARGSDVQRALSASAARSSINDPALADLARREQDAQRRITSLSDILRSLMAAPPAQQLPSVIAQMRKDVDALAKERGELKRDIERRFPAYAELVDPKPVTLASVQATLRPGETLISIYGGEDAAFVWAVPKSGAPMLSSAPLSSEQIGKTVAQLRKALDPQASTIDEIPAFDVATAAKLYEDLLKPVEPAWKGTSAHLLIVPHGALGQLPFGLLPTAAATLGRGDVIFDEYRGVPWLIRQAALTQLPSVTALSALRRTPAPRGERRMYLGIGDPFFSKEQATEALQVASAAPATTTTRGIPVRLRSAPKTSSVSSAELALLPRLPDTSEELTEIAKTLGANLASDLILNKNANVKNVTTMNLADRRIVHFATHGLVPGELNGLTQPALALTAPEVAGVDGDGLLTMDMILGLKLNADWVVLSACNTASGDGAGTEAVSGLGRAFFYAGARALLVSNWPVDSVAARRLMTDLFKRYAAGAATAKAESLQRAMTTMIDSPGALDPSTGKAFYAYAHPLFWAPFVLVGD